MYIFVAYIINTVLLCVTVLVGKSQDVNQENSRSPDLWQPRQPNSWGWPLYRSWYVLASSSSSCI